MLWNRIKVDSLNIVLDNSKTMYLKIDNYVKLDITVNENVNAKIVIIANNNYDINISLNKLSNLVVNSLNKDNDVNVNVNLMEKANINYHHSTLAINDSQNNFNIYHLENSSISNLNNNGINMNGNKLYFTINGRVPKNLQNITCNQKSKIINFQQGNSKIIPNLIIDSNDIIASHAAYLGEIDYETKFYLQSRGISENNIQKLIYKSTLLGTMELTLEKEEFEKIINEWW